MKFLKGPPDLVVFEAPEALAGRGRLTLPTVWNNEGGKGQGLLVTVSGPAVEEGRLLALHAVLGPPGQTRRVALVPGLVGDQPVAFAEVPDWELHPGVADPPGPASGADLAVVGAAMLPVTIEGEVAAPGRTTLHLVVSAAVASEADLWTVELDLE